MSSWTDFTAPCPRGHPGARWRSALEEVVGVAGHDYLGLQVPTYRIECDRCDVEPVVRA